MARTVLKGTPELKRRMKAIKTIFKTAGRDWADETAIVAKRMVPVKTGTTRDSIRRRNATQRKATVVGHYAVNFIDAGAKAHDVVARKQKALKFSSSRGPVFRRKVHKRAQRAQLFKRRAAEEGLRKADLASDLIKLWNDAA